MNTCSLLLFSCLILLTRPSYSQTVTIGNQVWMTKNLNVDTFRNGDKIPEAKTAEEWVAYGKAGKAAWCYYDNDPANGEKYGKLYNWFAVIDARGIAPRGWRVPNNNDWATLGSFLGGDSIAAPKLKSINGWKNFSLSIPCPNCRSNHQKNNSYSNDCKTCNGNAVIDSVISGNGDNSSGFSALPSGFRDKNGYDFRRLRTYAAWWSSSTDCKKNKNAWAYWLIYDWTNIIKEDYSMVAGISVRCIKD